MNNINRYHSILNLFNKHEIEYLIIGTWALFQYFPSRMKDYFIKDCDILIKKDIHQIREIMAILKNDGWLVKVWEEEIDEKVQLSFLEHKYYFRAYKDEMILDLSYEYPYLDWDESYSKRTRLNGFTLANVDDILYLKKLKGRPVDLELISELLI